MTTCYHVEKKLFFVHVPKCAGSAIGGELRHEDGEWVDCYLNKKLPGWTREGLPNGHQPVRAIKHFMGAPLKDWNQIIVTIRNPFEQQLSQWAFWRNRARKRILKRDEHYHPDERFALSRSLDDFVADPQSNGPVYTCGRRWEQAGGVYRWWAANWANEIPPNVTIIRTEDLPDGLSGALGVDCSDLPITNTSRHGRWQDAYSPRGLQAVRRKYAWSLALHYPEVLQEAEDLIKKGARSDAVPA